MEPFNLVDFSTQWVLTAALVFARIGTAVVLLPGFGESQVPSRFKIGLGLAISLGMMPALANPVPPASTVMLALMLGLEVLVGVFIGLGAKLLMAALHTLRTGGFCLEPQQRPDPKPSEPRKWLRTGFAPLHGRHRLHFPDQHPPCDAVWSDAFLCASPARAADDGGYG